MRPIDSIMQEISAPATLNEMMQRNLDMVNRRSAIAGRHVLPGQSSTTVQELDEVGHAVQIDQSMQLRELRNRLQHAQTTEAAHERHRVACSRHVEQMQLYVQAAIDRGEAEGYIVHVRSLLSASEERLVEAVSQVSALTDAREVLEGRLNDLVAAATEQ